MAPTPRQIDLKQAAAAVADERATMASIALRLGVAKPTLYRIAGSREELVRLCVDAEAERLLEHMHAAFAKALDSEPVARLAEGFLGFFRFARDSPAGFDLLFGGRHAAEAVPAVRRVEDRLRDLLRREARAAGTDLEDADLLAAALIGAAAGVVGRLGPELRRRDLRELAAMLARRTYVQAA